MKKELLEEDFSVIPIMAYKNKTPVKSLYPEGAGFLYNFIVIHSKIMRSDGFWHSVGFIVEDAETNAVLTYDSFNVPEQRIDEVLLYKAMPRYTFEIKEIDILEFDGQERKISEVNHYIKIWRNSKTQTT